MHKRFHSHRLILSTVWERHIPTVLAIGPQADPKEPRLNAEIAATILSEFGRLWGVRVERITSRELEKAFETRARRTLKRALRDHVSMLPSDKRALGALAAAVYAATDRTKLLRAACCT